MEGKPDNIFDVTPRFLGDLESWLVQQGFKKSGPTSGLAGPIGSEVSYTEFTANVAITANSAATAQAVVTAPSITFDGVTSVVIEFFANTAGTPVTAGNYMLADLWDGSTDLGVIVQLVTPAALSMQGPVLVRRKITPAAGAHTFSIKGWVSAPTGTFYAGTGGPGAYLPGYIRITKA
jgi:hypothetical protein